MPCKRAASIHASSLFGHASHAFLARSFAAFNFPAISSNRAAAIHPGACFGFVFITDFKSKRAFLISEISAAELIFNDDREVKYPLGSTVDDPF